MTGPTPTTRRPHPTPACLILGLLVVEGLLWLSERYQWPTWHKGYAVLTAVATVGVVMIVMLGWFIVALVFRWRFQFSIRSLLVLTLVVALPCSWLAAKMKEAKGQKMAVTNFPAYTYDYQDDPFPNFGGVPNWQPSGPVWLRWLLGNDFFNDVVGAHVLSDGETEHLKVLPRLQWLELYAEVTDAGLANIVGLTQLQRLKLDGTQITDAGLARIAGMVQLQSLELGNAQITEAGLTSITGLTQLRDLSLHSRQITDAGLARLTQLSEIGRLDLSHTHITDAGLVHLARFSQLRTLILEHTNITNAGLPYLARLTRLQGLDLAYTHITDAATERLHESLIGCHIFSYDHDP